MTLHESSRPCPARSGAVLAPSWGTRRQGWSPCSKPGTLDLMTSLAHNIQCLWCRHFRTNISGVDDLANGWRCDAYPKRIPDAILDNEVDHRQPYEGDSGIVFEPRDDVAARIAAEIFE